MKKLLLIVCVGLQLNTFAMDSSAEVARLAQELAAVKLQIATQKVGGQRVNYTPDQTKNIRKEKDRTISMEGRAKSWRTVQERSAKAGECCGGLVEGCIKSLCCLFCCPRQCCAERENKNKGAMSYCSDTNTYSRTNANGDTESFNVDIGTYSMSVAASSN